MAFKPVTKFPCRDINQLHPAVRALVLAWIIACKKILKITISLSQTYRSNGYQAKLHKDNPNGAAAPGLSMHEFRCAADFYINMKGVDIYDDKKIRACGKLAKKMGLTWGGDFPNYDGCHVEFTGKYTRAQIRAGKIPE